MPNHFYIWTDSAGVETKREEKGRGKQKKNSVQREDGNFYIVEGAAPVEKSTTPKAPKPEKVQHFYVWVDSNNVEIHREAKGRGKQKKGSEQREDGNYYINSADVPSGDDDPAEHGEVTSPVKPEKVQKFVIWLDGNGAEIQRQAKGRGRPPRGSEVGKDGNYYITGVTPESKPTTKLVVDPNQEVPVNSQLEKVLGKLVADGSIELVDVPAAVVPDQKPIKQVKDIVHPSLKDFEAACLPLKRLEENGIITLTSPVIIRDIGMTYVQFNAQYAKMVIDTFDNTLAVWKVTGNGPADLVITNALSE